MRGKWRAQRADGGAHAARGFVSGAAISRLRPPQRNDVSMPHAALWVVQQSAFADASERVGVSMPHAALWVVQQLCRVASDFKISQFQCRTRLFPFAPTTASRSPSPARAGEAWLGSVFSQNHAILASPADAGEVASTASRWGRSCRTRLCEWCSNFSAPSASAERCFNAARGFVGGAAECIRRRF